MLEVFQEIFQSGYIPVFHPFLILIKATRDNGLHIFESAEILIVYLYQCLTFNLVFKSGQIRAELPANVTPENGVLWLRIKNHTIKIEKRYFYHFAILNTLFGLQSYHF